MTGASALERVGAQKAAARRRSTEPRAPLILLIPAGLALLFLLGPLLALVLRVPWTHLPALILEPTVLSALRLSLVCATVATALAFVLGVPAAWWLSRRDDVAGTVVRSLVTLPLVLPPVVGGVALLMAFGRTGLIGRPLAEATGLTIPFTTLAVILAEAFVAMPFLVVSVEGALRGADPRLAEAAATLGASPSRVFWRVTLALIRPGLLAGGVLCWARALGEFGATMMFAGNFPGKTQTMPIAVYLAMETDPDAALALSVVMVALSVTVLLLLRHRWLAPTLGRVP